MILKLSKGGGLIPGMNSATYSLNVDTLEQPLKDKLEALLQKAAVPRAYNAVARDAICYRIDSDSQLIAKFTDGNRDADLDGLLTIITQYGKKD